MVWATADANPLAFFKCQILIIGPRYGEAIVHVFRH